MNFGMSYAMNIFAFFPRATGIVETKEDTE